MIIIFGQIKFKIVSLINKSGVAFMLYNKTAAVAVPAFNEERQKKAAIQFNQL